MIYDLKEYLISRIDLGKNMDKINGIRKIIYILLGIIALLILAIMYLLSIHASIVAALFGPILGALITLTVSLWVELKKKESKDLWDHFSDIKSKCLTALRYNIIALGYDVGYFFVNEGTNFITPAQVDTLLDNPVHPWDAGRGGVDFRVMAGLSFTNLKQIVDEALYDDLERHKITKGIIPRVEELKKFYTENAPKHLELYKQLYSNIINNNAFKQLTKDRNAPEKVKFFSAVFFRSWDIDIGVWPNIFKDVSSNINEIDDISLSIKQLNVYKETVKIEEKMKELKNLVIKEIDNAMDTVYLDEQCKLVKLKQY